MNAQIGVLTIEIFIPGSQSLKMKRMVVKSIKDRIKNQFNVSIAEIDHQDKWQRCCLGCTMIAGEKKLIERTFQEVDAFLGKVGDIEIVQTHIEFL